MTTLSWLGAADVTHGSDDNAIFTRTNGATMLETRRLNDGFGSTLGSQWTSRGTFTITESGGQVLLDSEGTTDGTSGIRMDGHNVYDLDDPFDFQVDVVSVTLTDGSAAGFQFFNATGAAEGVAVSAISSGGEEVSARSFDGGVLTIHAAVSLDLSTLNRIRVTGDGSASQNVNWYYDDDGSWTLIAGPVNLSALAGTDAKPDLFIFGDDVAQNDITFDNFTEEAGNVYWEHQAGFEPLLNNRVFGVGDVQLSTFLPVDETGTMKWDYTTDGGSTYTETKRTTAQIQALPDITDATQFGMKAFPNEGGSNALASVKSATINVAQEGGGLNRRRRRR